MKWYEKRKKEKHSVPIIHSAKVPLSIFLHFSDVSIWSDGIRWVRRTLDFDDVHAFSFSAVSVTRMKVTKSNITRLMQVEVKRDSKRLNEAIYLTKAITQRESILNCHSEYDYYVDAFGPVYRPRQNATHNIWMSFVDSIVFCRLFHRSDATIIYWKLVLHTYGRSSEVIFE